MNESLDAGFFGESGDSTRPLDVDVLEVEILRFPFARDEIDDDVRVFDRSSDGLVVAQVERMEENLTEIAGEFQRHHGVRIASVRENHLKMRSLYKKSSSRCYALYGVVIVSR